MPEDLPPVYESKEYATVAKELQDEGVLKAFADALNETLAVDEKLGRYALHVESLGRTQRYRQ